MDHEEKLRLAKEALKSGSYDRKTIEYIFPELKESEEEKIRKEIISALKFANHKGVYDKHITWLEKQGEQKHATMSLDEAIEHCKEKSCGDNACALEHKQLEKWLTELKELKERETSWSEEDEATYYGVIETEQYMLDVVNGIRKFDVGNISIKEECTRELNWLKSLKDRVQLKHGWRKVRNI